IDEVWIDKESSDPRIDEVVLHAIGEGHVAVLRQGDLLRLLPERDRLGDRQLLRLVEQGVHPWVGEFGHVVAGLNLVAVKGPVHEERGDDRQPVVDLGRRSPGVLAVVEYWARET